MNNWYIDRSKNFIHDGLRDILSIINESELAGEEMSTNELAKKFAKHQALGNAIGNPNAAFTRFRDHGLIRMNNSLGDTAKMYLNEKFTFGELVIDLFVKRFASKYDFQSLHPVVMLCKLFSCMMNMGVDIDDVFITYFECHEYLLPINSYDDVNYELVEKIISEREYSDTDSGNVLQHRVELSDNEETNYSIWFNALKQTPLFVSLEENDNRYTLRPNQKQKEFFNYLSENADEFKDGDIKNNSTLYKYYCNREYGLSEIIAPVIKPDVTIEKDDVKILFDYLFGYDQRVDFDYSTYVKHECFGTYFAFISIPDIAIAKIEEDNPQIADQLYKYVRNMGTYYLDNIDIAYGNLKSGEKVVAKITEEINLNEMPLKASVEQDNYDGSWFVGGRIDDIDYSKEMIDKGMWKCLKKGTENVINSIAVGDNIVLKSSYPQKHNLPFDNNGQQTACLKIIALGKVVENPHNGESVLVDWYKTFENKVWYKVEAGGFRRAITKFYTRGEESRINLLNFVFYDIPQDFSNLSNISETIDILPELIDDEVLNETSNETIETFEYIEKTMVPKQIIYYGAPGTGKSFEVDKQLVKKYPDEEARDYHTARVVFHPDYTYSDFVGSIRPVKPEGKSLTYEFVAGPFSELLKKCFLHSDEEFYLVLEEINRGNAAAIFGDLFQLLDRDDKKGKSSYRINNTDIAGFLKKDNRLASLFANDKVWLPSNFNIICTMNTADQNVFVLDSAFKRRFSEEYTEIDFSKLTQELKETTAVFNGTTDLQHLFANTNLKNFVEKLAENNELNRDWPTFAKIVNYIIDDINEESGSEQISEDKKLGPFFVSVKDLESRKNFINKVLHYLKQDVFKYVDFYFTESYQTIHSKYINESADIFNLLKRQGE